MSAYVTVTDAAGRVLFRRPATDAEILEAIQVADAADAEAHASLRRIAAERDRGHEVLAEARAEAEASRTEMIAEEEPEIVSFDHSAPRGELDNE